MIEREMLEWAAKAAEVCGFWVDAGINIKTDASPQIWNPLTNDGDALRLAVKLEIDGIAEPVWVKTMTSIADYERDPYAATRLAITRAAAEIGKSRGESDV